MTVEIKEIKTHAGSAAQMSVRVGTNDTNSLLSCMTDDEYGLRDLPESGGVAVDVGSHAGGVAVSLGMMGTWRVIAVEALSENVALIRESVERNNLDGSVTVLHRAAAKAGKKSAVVHWNFGGDGESAQHHRFIANAQLPQEKGGQRETVPTISLATLVEMAGGHIDFLKADCEGGEYGLFDSPAVKDVALIRGEYHTGEKALRALLEPTHDVTTDGNENMGGFTATRR